VARKQLYDLKELETEDESVAQGDRRARQEAHRRRGELHEMKQTVAARMP
jgi:hypothetical protein